jgi:hypothetical protein
MARRSDTASMAPISTSSAPRRCFSSLSSSARSEVRTRHQSLRHEILAQLHAAVAISAKVTLPESKVDARRY